MLWLLVAYLMGSVPFGLILSYFGGIGDIRYKGSGNIGATNMMRIGGRKLGIATFFLDAAKGGVITYAAKIYVPQLVIYVAFMSVIGHIFPIWLKFKGGKGVATSIAVITIMDPLIGISIIAVWLLIFKTTRISALSAIIAFSTMPLFYWYYGRDMSLFYLILLWSIIILIRHYSNILSLISLKKNH